MIRFAERQVAKILSGEKRVTRINVPSPWKEGETITAVRLADGIDKPFAVLEVRAVRKHRLGELTDEDARLEGYSSRDEFEKTWRELHGSFDPEQEVWALEFELVHPITDEELKP